LEARIEALDAVARGDEFALVATFLELAQRYRERGRHDFACLLAYRSIEALVHLGLKRKGNGRFDARKPSYPELGDATTLEHAFCEASRALGHVGVAALPHRVGLFDGFLLLCLVDGVEKRFTPPLTLMRAMKAVKTLAEKRNSSVLAHGQTNLGPNDSQHLLHQAVEFGHAILEVEYETVQLLCERLKPFPLRDIAPPVA
jgi:hypothetical protein